MTTPKIKLVALYTLALVPGLILASELALGTYFQIRGVNFPRPQPGATRYDPITGWRGYINHDPTQDRYNTIALDRHTLIRTPYQTAASDHKRIGVLLLGNSGAMGIFSSNNQTSLSGQLESQLRQHNRHVDLINVSFHSFNSWMEHAELMRYLNAQPTHPELPAPKLVVSYGGVQDFWRFIQILHSEKEGKQPSYQDASWLMLDQKNLAYAATATRAMEGDLGQATKVFLNAVLETVRRNSRIMEALRQSRTGVATNSAEKGAAAKAAANHQQLNTAAARTPRKGSSSTLASKREQTVAHLFKLEPWQYRRRRDEIINSITRNVRASTAALNGIPYLYVYSPTIYGSELGHDFVNRVHTIPGGIRLSGQQIQLLQQDFKEKLLTQLEATEGLTILDLSAALQNLPTDQTFADHTHLNDNGAALLAPVLASKIKTMLQSAK